jgi:hypothetical protein
MNQPWRPHVGFTSESYGMWEVDKVTTKTSSKVFCERDSAGEDKGSGKGLLKMLMKETQ